MGIWLECFFQLWRSCVWGTLSSPLSPAPALTDMGPLPAACTLHCKHSPRGWASFSPRFQRELSCQVCVSAMGRRASRYQETQPPEDPVVEMPPGQAGDLSRTSAIQSSWPGTFLCIQVFGDHLCLHQGGNQKARRHEGGRGREPPRASPVGLKLEERNAAKVGFCKDAD